MGSFCLLLICPELSLASYGLHGACSFLPSERSQGRSNLVLSVLLIVNALVLILAPELAALS